MATPIGIGMWKSRLRAMADPITSARSQAVMATSASSQRAIADTARVVVAAGLREVPAGRDAEFGREGLQKHRQKVRDEDDTEQRVSEPCAAGEIGGPVPRVHVADRNEIPGTGERQRLPPP